MYCEITNESADLLRLTQKGVLGYVRNNVAIC